MAAICKLWRCPDHREQRCHACPSGGPLNAQYTPQPHTDPDALIRRADAILRRWMEIYGEHNPQWLPPAGIVNWQEDAGRYLALRSLPTPNVASIADAVVALVTEPQRFRQCGWCGGRGVVGTPGRRCDWCDGEGQTPIPNSAGIAGVRVEGGNDGR